MLHAAAVAELAQCAVPKLDPGLDTGACGAPSSLFPMRRVREQIFEQLTPLGTMIVAIEFDVSIDVVDEMAQPIIVVPRGIVRRSRLFGQLPGRNKLKAVAGCWFDHSPKSN